MSILLDGKAYSNKIQLELAKKVANIKQKYNKVPGLAVILVGDDPASHYYVNRKEKMAQKIGINSKQIKLSEDIDEEILLNTIEDLNKDSEINAILVQLPLPKHINTNKVIRSIKPQKDVDGLHPVNMGDLLSGNIPYAIACTPLGIIKLLKEYNIELKGKNAVVIGRSNIVGKPISILLLAEHATVTMCHSKTKNIDDICRRADIIVVAIGKEAYLKGDWVTEGAIIVDVGINKNKNTGKICGDVDFESVEPKSSYITPVPGGIGPMTIAMLLNNTVELFEKSLVLIYPSTLHECHPALDAGPSPFDHDKKALCRHRWMDPGAQKDI